MLPLAFGPTARVCASVLPPSH